MGIWDGMDKRSTGMGPDLEGGIVMSDLNIGVHKHVVRVDITIGVFAYYY